MPLWRVETKCRYLQFDTGNRWYVMADDIAGATNAAFDIVAALAPITYTGVEYYRVRVSTPSADGRNGKTSDISVLGTKPMTRRLPPDVCGMFKLAPFAPTESMNFKFLRWVLSADDQQDGILTNGALAALQGAASELINTVGLYTAKGTVISSIQADRYTHTHDFNRAWGDRTPKE